MNRPFSREVPEPFCQVAVVPTGFPERVFTLAEAEEFGDALNNCVVNYKEARRKRNLRFVQPSFLSFFKKNGGILLSCEDETTVRWLKVAVKFVKLTGGCTIRIDDKEALDNRFLVEGRGTHSRFDANNIIQNLERFNNELDVSRWKVVREKLTRSGRIITIEMEGRSVGMLRRRRNRLSLDQAGIHKFTILTISPVGRTRPVRQVEVIEITEEDLAAIPSREILDSSDSDGVVVGLNDSTTIEEVSSQSNAGDSFDVDGDAFILSTDLEKFAGLEVEISEEYKQVRRIN
ncbi:uncharacterized protein LOC113464357 [Ceratina calcarata]|uniref:Uncharacterized protein LOC113464357 n=1 Tax=Ceratina calcarata TaxID=156304 RepID=A0AAJ7WAN9_9HYME|nr:uncharacterized protein LOC113464357 [Ceratina calcarata]